MFCGVGVNKAKFFARESQRGVESVAWETARPQVPNSNRQSSRKPLWQQHLRHHTNGHSACPPPAGPKPADAFSSRSLLRTSRLAKWRNLSSIYRASQKLSIPLEFFNYLPRNRLTLNFVAHQSHYLPALLWFITQISSPHIFFTKCLWTSFTPRAKQISIY